MHSFKTCPKISLLKVEKRRPLIGAWDRMREPG
jgi:hypothetical protein